jgi:ParB-like chromosome segregation protein Spo0J
VTLGIHPLAEIFPPMSDEAFAALVADIRKNGLREPIVLHEGKVLDGRNRYRACVELGIEHITKPWDQRGDALSYVLSTNLHRRHLCESQRALVAARIENFRHGGDRRSEDQEANRPLQITREKAAELLNVGERSVQRAAIVHDRGVPELQKAVETGAVSVWSAVEVARRPAAEQCEIAERGSKAIAEAAKAIRANRKSPKVKRYGISQQRVRANIWIALRDALFNLS